jgi:hypothetical protein
MKHWSMAVLIVGTAAARLHSQQGVKGGSASVAERSCLGAWTRPSALKLDRTHRVYVDAPELSHVGNDLWAVGEPTLLTDPGEHVVRLPDDTAWLAAGVRLQPSNGSLRIVRRPAGAREFIAPRIVASDNGAHVIWAAGANPQRHGDPTASEIWAARPDSANWEAPRLVARAKSIAWNNTMSSALVAFGAELYAAAPLGLFPDADVLFAHSRGDAWGIDTIARGEGSRYVAMETLDSLLYLVTVATPNRLLVRQSADGGQHWSAPIEIVRATDAAPHAPRLSAPRGLASGEPLFIVWGETDNSGLPYDRIALAASTDAGASWRLLPPLKSASALGFSIARIRGKHLAVATLVASADERVDVSEWDGARWRRSASFAPAASRPSLIVVGDSLNLFWGVGPARTDDAPHTRISKSRIQCALTHGKAVDGR